MNLEEFIQRWAGATGGAERANYALFLTELCDVLALPHPEPASAIFEDNDYVFERSITRKDGSKGRIDLYKRDCFVLEAKQSRQKQINDMGEKNEKYISSLEGKGPATPANRGRRTATRSWDVLMINAREQAEAYARDLPQDHGWPPFVIVCDVGHSFEFYADFQRMGKYDQFPDRMGFRIFLEDLASPDVQERFKAIWTTPRSLDPATRSEQVTRQVAGKLADVSKALEARGDEPEEVAHFLMRCLFTMFAEDVELLPKNSFQLLLRECANNPAAFEPCLKDLWEKMDTGGYAVSIKAAVKRFNGSMFKDAHVLSLGADQVNDLLSAANANWREVEPSIFGTLLERALTPADRGKLGAHYTPRAYVEKLVTETIVSPLREDWRLVVAAAEERNSAGDYKGAAVLVQEFHEALCTIRVLDPACGTGNFLYVALELMKRLEGEVLEALSSLGGQEAIRGLMGHTVGPQQFSGIELNPRAAAIAELVIWIGDLQWHFRTRGGFPAEPILQDFNKIDQRDAVLEYARTEPVSTTEGPQTRWDGFTRRIDAISGRLVPDTSARVSVVRYVDPFIPGWPDADFIVGNPPFIGTRRLKERQGTEYVETLRKTYKHLAKTVDYVMYWYYLAADRVAKGATRRSGLITTNSIVQDYSRPVLDYFVTGDNPKAKLVYAVTNHPWVDEDDGAAVRIAMTVLASPNDPTIPVVGEMKATSDGEEIVVETQVPRINSTLRNVPDVLSVGPLKSNEAMCAQGVVPANEGFKIQREQLQPFLRGTQVDSEIVRPYIIGNDLNDRFAEKYIIDATGLSETALREDHPNEYQWLKINVYPERQENPRESYRNKWWLFAEPRPRLRSSFEGLSRFIATPYTAQHRTFQFWSTRYVPDAMVYCIPSDDAFVLAVLSSSVHATWCRYCSGTLETRPRYNSNRTFFPFPFPRADDRQKQELRKLAEDLDQFRKARQQEHPALTLTQMYNVRDALIEGRSLSENEANILRDGCVLVLKELHEQLDKAVFAAYGWNSSANDVDLLGRLVALNKERITEEADGTVEWIRPSFQRTRTSKHNRDVAPGMNFGVSPTSGPKQQLPSAPVERTSAIIAVLLASAGPLTISEIAGKFRRGVHVEEHITGVLAALVRTGAVLSPDFGKTFLARRAS